MDINTITSAFEEAKQIQSRHDGVHRIHNIVSVLGTWKQWVEEDYWEEANKTCDFNAHFDFVVKDMRHIDKTGFPLKDKARSQMKN